MGQYIFIRGTVNANPITFVFIYTHNTAQLHFLQESFAQLALFQAGEVVVGGDFNYIMDTMLDRSHSSKHQRNQKTTPSSTELASILHDFQLFDVWRHFYVEGLYFLFCALQFSYMHWYQ